MKRENFMNKRIGLVGDNSIEYIGQLIRIWNDGDCAVLIDWHIPFNTTLEILKEASVHECYVDEGIFEKWNCDTGEINFRTFVTRSIGIIELPVFVYDSFNENYSNDEAIVIYSSGTTGKVKGVVHSHYAINSNADAIIQHLKIENDCFFIVKPLFHAATLTGELLVGMKAKMKIIITPTGVLPRLILSNIERCSTSILCLNPTLLHIYVEEIERNSYNLSSLKMVLCSGSLLSDKLTLKARKALFPAKVFNMYGLSEAGPRISMQSDGFYSIGSVGIPLNGIEVSIMDAEGNIVGTNCRGNVFVKTPSCFIGYVSSQLKNNIINGWLNTGDIGLIKETGEIYLYGRNDDVIIRGSHNVCPHEVEKIILEHRSVIQCTVFGYPDERLGEKIVCFYISKGTSVSSKELYFHCAKCMPSYEIPMEFYNVKMIPSSVNGKTTKKLLIDFYDKYMLRV